MNHGMDSLVKHHRQGGVTLLSLMAGLLISTISVLASISAYQNLHSAASATEAGLVHDGQISTTLVIVEKYVMDAGYGIASAGLDDIKVVSEAATSTSYATTSLLWRYNDGTSSICTGLREIGLLIGTGYYRALKSIGSSADCNTSSDLESFSWADDAIPLGLWPVTVDMATYLDTNETLITFTISTLTCSPYGYGAPEDHLSLTISIPSTAELAGADMPTDDDTQICLSNMYPS